VAFQTGLEGKPWYYGAAMGLVMGGLLVALLHMWQLKPIKAEIARLQAKQGELDAKIVKGKSAEKKLPQLKESVAAKQKELTVLLRVLPARLETQTILRKIRSLAEEGDFQLRAFKPEQRFTEKDFYKEWPIRIKMNGSYHNLAVFFDKIRQDQRLFNIEKLKIIALRGQRTNFTLETEFTAKTFVQTEVDSATETAKPAPPPAPPARGPR
jgi:type IV pilus assembly protein PilO